MIFSKPTKHQETKVGYSESYHLDTEDLSFTIETVSGGWRALSSIEENSLVYILRGGGTAKLKKDGKEFSIDGEIAIDIPAHSFFKLDEGQYRYAYITGLTSHSVEENKGTKEFEISEKPRLIYVLDGIGNANFDNNKHVLKEGYLMEFPKDSNVVLNGNFKYILING